MTDVLTYIIRTWGWVSSVTVPDHGGELYLRNRATLWSGLCRGSPIDVASHLEEGEKINYTYDYRNVEIVR